jgi:DNA-binding XRE family transcriptional regulator
MPIGADDGAHLPMRVFSGRGVPGVSGKSNRFPLRNHLGRLAYARGLTDAELGARAGVSRAQVNRIRNARVIPRVGSAMALAAALGCRIRDVFYVEVELDAPSGPQAPS